MNLRSDAGTATAAFVDQLSDKIRWYGSKVIQTCRENAV
jgi:hypothetical protein